MRGIIQTSTLGCFCTTSVTPAVCLSNQAVWLPLLTARLAPGAARRSSRPVKPIARVPRLWDSNPSDLAGRVYHGGPGLWWRAAHGVLGEIRRTTG